MLHPHNLQEKSLCTNLKGGYLDPWAKVNAIWGKFDIYIIRIDTLAIILPLVPPIGQKIHVTFLSQYWMNIQKGALFYLTTRIITSPRPLFHLAVVRGPRFAVR
jgi:hypothetical protein